MSKAIPLQHAHPEGTCYGCGPSNAEGLHIESYWSDDGESVIATARLGPKYNSGFPTVMYGGAVACLIDCHSIWTATAYAYRAEGRPLESLPRILYVTGQILVNYIKPTPLEEPVHLKAWAEGEVGRKTRIICELGPSGDVTATGEVMAILVDHPLS